MLAHELRNPLAPIRNAVHIMQDPDVVPSTMIWARDVIGRQADHMARLIDDLLDVSRIVQGKVVVQPQRLQLATLVERAVEATAPGSRPWTRRSAWNCPRRSWSSMATWCGCRRCCPT